MQRATALYVTTLLLFAIAGVLAQDKPAEELGTYVEAESLPVPFANLTSLCVDAEGTVYACDAAANQVKIIDPSGELLATWEMDFAPNSIHVHTDGTVYVGGRGVLVRMSKSGKIIARIDTDGGRIPNARVSGIATTDDDLFASFGSGGSTRATAVILRMSLNFGEPVMIAKGLRGCCQRLDLAARDNVLYVAENARHHVLLMDRDGKVLSKWGERAREGLEGFGSCCNPMNLYFDAAGVLYTAESGLGRVKAYRADGKFLGLIGYVGTNRFNRASGLAASCSNVAFGAGPGLSKFYVLDFKNNIIRVLVRRAQ